MYKPKDIKKYKGRWVLFKWAGQEEIFKVRDISTGITGTRKINIWLCPVSGTSPDKYCSGYKASACFILTDEERILKAL